jgi:hypothetical protein
VEACMQPGIVTVHGVVVRGYRVASQKSKDYPYGTIDKQKPVFKELDLDLERFYSGTLNISIAPDTFKVVNPQYIFRQVAWTDLHPPEDFSFSRCMVIFKAGAYEGFVYYPHPETKKRHFESDSILEVITVQLPGLKYGDQIALDLEANEILVIRGNN